MHSEYPTTQGYYRWDGYAWHQCLAVDVRHHGGNAATLLETVLYVAQEGRVAFASQGLRFDGGSKPRVTWAILGHPFSDYLPAYAIHDAMCINAEERFFLGIVSKREFREERKHADKVFLEGQRWIHKQRVSGKRGRWERLKLRAKYRAVRLNAWWVKVRTKQEAAE